MTPTSDTPGLDRLRELNRVLTGLLADPQPGLSTWRMMLSKTLMEMADFAGEGKVSQYRRVVEALEAIVFSPKPPPDTEGARRLLNEIAKMEGR